SSSLAQTHVATATPIPIYGNRLGKVSCVRAFLGFRDTQKRPIFLFFCNSGRKTALAFLLELLPDR
ncbi:hypothetical protein ACEQ6A_35905, partial [Rhizobium brockwellii]|uniref:hypothetical protein n=1 Tax=Rhizobium brockwellii TaxID=3019932 RepID=UPI003F9DB594